MRYTLVLIPLIAFLALACGDGEEPQPTATPTTAPTATAVPPSPTPEATPSVEYGPLSEEAPLEGVVSFFIIDLARGRWLRVLPGYLAISPDGETVVYRTEAGLEAARIDGSGRHLITDDPAIKAANTAAFSHDGEVLALWGRESSLVLVTFPEGRPTQVAVRSVIAVDWSPTSRTLAVDTPEDILFVSPEGRVLGANVGPHASAVAWAPQEERLAFWTSDDAGSTVFTVAPGDDPRVVAQLPGEQIFGLSWSPEGSLLAVSARRLAPPDVSPGPVPDVRVLDVASGQTRFTVTSADEPHWSPTESLLLFAGNVCFQGYQSMLVNGDGSDLRPLTSVVKGTPHVGAWSPDGGEVATAWVERDTLTAVDVESGERRTILRGGVIVGASSVQWVTADRLVVTIVSGTGFCEGGEGDATRVVFP